MRLKRWDAVDWLELPRIEHPNHARFILEREININGCNVCRVEGLQEALWSDTQWTRNGILDRDSHAALMRRVSQGEVFLIHDIGLIPAFPLLRRDGGENIDKWVVNDYTMDYFVRDRVDWMLSRAVDTKGIWAPVIVPKKATTEKAPAKSEGPKQNWLGVDILGTYPLQGHVVVCDDKWKPGNRKITATTHKVNNTTCISYHQTLPAKQVKLQLVYGNANIPLGFDSFDTTQKQPSGAAEHTVLAPLLLRRFTSPERISKEGGFLDAGYHVYLFMDGHLWRELYVSASGVCKDIDLKKHYGKEERKPSGSETKTVVVPVKLNNRTPKIEIAIAPRQWSWARVLAFGGLHEKDPRKGHDKIKADEVKSDKRAARLVTLDVDKLQNSQLQAPWFAAKDFSDREDLKSFKTSGLPVCQLDDPFGLALMTGTKIHVLIDQLTSCIESIEHHNENYKSAVTAYQTFFNPELNVKVKRIIYGGNFETTEEDYKHNDSQSEIFRKTSETLSRAYIEEVLKVKERKSLRKKIRQQLAEYAASLGGFLPPEEGQQHGKPIRESHQGAITFDAVLEDYAYLTGKNYLNLWETFTTYAGCLNYDPSDNDRGHDLPDTLEEEKSFIRPGRWYLDDIINNKNNHPLRAMLFPKDGDIDPYSAEDPQHNAEEKTTKIVNTVFRLNDFMGAAAEMNKKEGKEEESGETEGEDEVHKKAIEGIPKVLGAIVSRFISVYSKQWEHAIHNTTEQVSELMTSFAKATNMPELKGLRLVKAGDPLNGNVILDGSHHVMGRMNRDTRRSAFAQDPRHKSKTINSRTGESGKHLSTHEPDSAKTAIYSESGELIGSTQISDLANNRGVPSSLDIEEWKKMWGTEEGGVYKVKFKVTVLPKTNPIVLKLYLGEDVHVDGEVAAKAATLKWGGKILPPVIAVFELQNMLAAAHEYKESAENKLKFFAALTSLMVASGEATKALLGDDKIKEMAKDGNRYARLATSELEIKDALKLGAFEAANGVLAAVGSGIAVWDAASAFKKGDDDAGWADIANAAALTFQTACIIGAGAAEAGATAAWAAFFIPFAPWAAVAVMAVVITSMLVAEFTDSELEQWGKHGPLSSDESTRELYTSGDQFSEIPEYGSPEQAYVALMSLLNPVKVVIKEPDGYFAQHVEVEANAPGWVVGSDALDIRLTAADERGIFEGKAPQHSMDSSLYKIEQIQQQGQIVGMRYYYHCREGEQIYRARARRLIQKDLISLPFIPIDKEDETKKDDPVRIDESIPGWSYSGSMHLIKGTEEDNLKAESNMFGGFSG